MRTSWIALAACGALGSPAFAQSAPPDEDVVVVTGSATPVEYEKMGQPISVVTAQTIEDQGYAYVPDVIRQIPSAAVSQGGAPGSLTQVRIRGAEGNHTLVLLDGIDISSPDQGETDFSSLLTGDIQRIEVLRGPQSGLYGSNALAGVVNLITRKDVKGHYINAAIEGGEFNTLDIQANAGVGDGASYASAGVQYLRSDGYDISPDQTANGVPAVGQGATPGDKDGNRVSTIYGRGGVQLTPEFRVDGIARYMDRKAELDGQAFNFPIAGKTYDDASTTSQNQLMVGGSATLSLMDDKWVTVASASFVDEERRSTSTNFPFFTGPALPTPASLQNVTLGRSGADATRTKFTLQSTLEFGQPGFLSYLTGFVENKTETYDDPFTTRDEDRELNGIGVQYRGEFADQFYLFATARHDDNDDFDDADTYSIAASWVIPGIGTRPHASFGTGVTNPTFFEQFGFSPGSFVGNPNLAPEEAEGWDIGVEQTLFNGMAKVDLTYFESTLQNEIFTSFGPPPFFLSTPANRTTDSDRSGWEATFSLYPIDGLDIVGMYSHLDATEPAGIEVRRPEEQASLDGSWRIGGGPFQINLGVTYNGEMVDTDFGTFLRTGVDPYTLVRLGASYDLNDNIELYGRVENLLDEDYQEVIGFAGAPQAVYVGVRFRESTTK